MGFQGAKGELSEVRGDRKGERVKGGEGAAKGVRRGQGRTRGCLGRASGTQTGKWEKTKSGEPDAGRGHGAKGGWGAQRCLRPRSP